MPPIKAVRVRTATGWQDIALTGPAGPAGPTGAPGPTGPTGPPLAYVNTEDGLPPTATGHPVYLVLSDSLNDGDASLRYWDGTAWIMLSGGGGGGGGISGDYITVAADLTGLSDGKLLIWDAVDARFEPGAP